MPGKSQGTLRKLLHRVTLYLRPKYLLFNLWLISSLYAAVKVLRTPLRIALAMPAIKIIYDAVSRQSNLYKAVHSRLFNLMNALPMVQQKLAKDLNPALAELEADEFKHKEQGLRHLTLPAAAIPAADVLAELDTTDAKIKDPQKISGAIYVTPTTKQLFPEIYQRIAATNPMHADLWPSLQDKETQTVNMLLQLYNAPTNAWGMLTGGGSISIFMACLAARNRAANFFWPVTAPEIIASDRAHPAFKKACDFLNIKLVMVPVDSETFKVDIKTMTQAINPNTIMLVASAPAFPEGIMDNIEEVAALASYYDILCHVDACLGGFLLPFAKGAGLDLPAFDFSVPGVTSISADNHKYGLAEKGQSTIMFYNFEQLGQYATFTDLESKMGMYASIGIEGSRPARVNAWACMLTTGVTGYTENLQKMLSLKNEICEGITKIPDIHVSGEPLLPIFAIRADDPESVNALLIASKMHEKNWCVNGLPSPPGFHFCITPAHITDPSFVTTFLKHLKAATIYAKENPQEKPKGSLGMYDMFAHKIPSSIKGPVLDYLGRQYIGILGRAHKVFTPQHQSQRQIPVGPTTGKVEATTPAPTF